VKNLRHKIEPDPVKPRYVETVHGVGYRLGLHRE
jgi:DNA-binding response OmpR family regulator